MWGMTQKVMREEGGVKALYRGMVPTAMGVAPYVGINFAAYELLRGIITPPGKTSVVRKLSCGALAGASLALLSLPLLLLLCVRGDVFTDPVWWRGLSFCVAWRVGAISQTLTYPFDVVRRKMQVVGMGAAVGYQYNSALEAVLVIVRHEGILGMYRGLWPNLRTSPFMFSSSLFRRMIGQSPMLTLPPCAFGIVVQ